MKLKNNALQELYDTLANGTISFSPYAESPVAKAFRECDEKLQKDIDIWRRSNDFLRSANMDLVSNERKLEKELEELQKHIDIKNHLENEFRKLKEHVLENHKIIADVGSERDALAKERDDLLIRAHCAEDAAEDLKKECKGLHDRNNVLEKSNGTLLSANLDLGNSNCDLKNRIEQLEKDRDDWRGRAHCAEDEVMELEEKGALLKTELKDVNERLDKSIADRKALQENLDYYMDIYSKVQKDLVDAKIQIKYFTQSRDDWQNRVNSAEEEVEELKESLEKANADRTELQNDRDCYHGLYTDLRKDYDKLFKENRKLKARTDCLHSVRSGYDQGQTDLWVKLQNVNDSQPFELATCFPDVTGMEDILSWDLEDFLDAYKKWWEEKEKELLRSTETF